MLNGNLLRLSKYSERKKEKKRKIERKIERTNEGKKERKRKKERKKEKNRKKERKKENTIKYVLIFKVEIYWKTSNEWYPGVVGRFSSTEQKWRVHYEDKDNIKHRFNPEKWRISTTGHSARSMKVIESWPKKRRVS